MSPNVGRREFLRQFMQGTAALVAASQWLLRAQDDAGWSQARAILDRIQPPSFPDRDFNVTAYGAVNDGETDCTEAIRRAISACNSAGGGRVLVPKGAFLTGPVHLKSNVHLYLDDQATLLFSRDPMQYLPVVYSRWEGVELMNYSACVYADNVQNIAITGGGTLDGNSDCEGAWWQWNPGVSCVRPPGPPPQTADRNRLFEMGVQDVPLQERVFGEGSHLRPCLVQFCHSQNILIEGLTLKNSPMYVVNPVLCSNVTVRGIHVDSHGPNNDGCDPDSSRDVLIDQCTFDTGDDCIAIKSGRNSDGRRVGVSSENIIIRDCNMKDGHGGVTVGSEMSGGVRNVFVEACQMDSPNLQQALRFKTNAVRGGIIENIYFRDIVVGQVSNAVLQVDCQYEEGANGPERPIVRNIHLANINCQKSRFALQLRGLAASPIQDIHLEDCIFDHVAEPNVLENVETVQAIRVKINGEPFSGI